MEFWFGRNFIRDISGFTIYTPMNKAPVNRVGGMRKFLLNIFEVKQTRAIGKFINHPRRKLGQNFRRSQRLNSVR